MEIDSLKMATPKENRFRERKSFALVLRKGRTIKGRFLILKFLENSLTKSRFGFIVSKKISKKATERNKIKRRISEIVRIKIREIKKPIDAVFIARKSVEKQRFQEIEKEVIQLLKQTNKQ